MARAGRGSIEGEGDETNSGIGSWALLMAMYKASIQEKEEEGYKGYLSKAELIEHATPLCDAGFTTVCFPLLLSSLLPSPVHLLNNFKRIRQRDSLTTVLGAE